MPLSRHRSLSAGATVLFALILGAPSPIPHASADEARHVGEQPTRERVRIAGTKFVRGRSRVLVAAPIARVRQAVLDFDEYAEFMPYYKASRTLARKSDGTREVYMRVTALNDMVVMWAQLEMRPPRLERGVETHVSRFVKGNIDDFIGIWRLRPIDSQRTELSLEVFLKPKLPMPVGLMNEENVDGAVKGVTAMRKRIIAGKR